MKISRDESLPLRPYAPGELAGTMERSLTDFLLRQRHVGWGTVHAGPSEKIKISKEKELEVLLATFGNRPVLVHEESELARLYYGEFG